MSTEGAELWREGHNRYRDEERQAKLTNARTAGLTPEALDEYTESLYKKDPSALKQHVLNLLGRLRGQQPQPTPAAYPAQSATVGEAPLQVGGESAPITPAPGENPDEQAPAVTAPAPRATLPAPPAQTVSQPGAATQAQRQSQILSGGKSAEQQKLEGYKGQLGVKRDFDAQSMQETIAAVQKIQSDPNLSEDEKLQRLSLYGVSAPRRASTDEMKRQDYQSMLLSGQVPKGKDGNPLSYEAWVASQSASGREAGSTPKPQTPSQQYVSLLSKKILASQGKGKPLTDKENADLAAAQSGLTVAGVARANAFAAAQAHYGMVAVTDPNTGMDTLLTREQASAMARAGTPLLAGVVSAPTGMDKKNQMLAQSAVMQVETMENILKMDPNLTGPGAGQLTAFTQWLGSNSEDSQKFLDAATLLSEHGVGVFGGRNIHSIEDLKNIMGSWKTNPAALKAALEQTKTTMLPWVEAGGRLPAPKSGGGSAPKAGSDKGNTKGTVSLAKARTLPQYKGKSDAEITAAAKKLGYEVKP